MFKHLLKFLSIENFITCPEIGPALMLHHVEMNKVDPAPNHTNLHTRLVHRPQTPQPPFLELQPQPERQQRLNSYRWHIAGHMKRKVKAKPNITVSWPTSVPTFIRSTRSLLTWMAPLYRSVLCASVTLSSQGLSAVSEQYFSPTATATPTPTPHSQILDFDLYLKKSVFVPPIYRFCCWRKTLLARAPCPRGVSNGDPGLVSCAHLAQKPNGENSRAIVRCVAPLSCCCLQLSLVDELRFPTTCFLLAASSQTKLIKTRFTKQRVLVRGLLYAPIVYCPPMVLVRSAAILFLCLFIF